MSSLVSCYIPIRKANYNDIYCEMQGGKWLDLLLSGGTLTLSLQVQEKIKDLVLQVDIETGDGMVLKTFTFDVGNVVPGNQYTFRLNIGDIPIEYLDSSTMYRVQIIDGYVVIP